MATPATEDLRELERLLVIEAERGATVTEAHLREELGVGHDDLRELLSTLCEVGKAVEEAPGEWTGGDGVPAAQEAPRVVVKAGEPEEVDGPPAVRSSGLPGWGLEPPAQVRLSRGMIEALGAEALGALIKAGISDTVEGGTFRLEVTP